MVTREARQLFTHGAILPDPRHPPGWLRRTFWSGHAGKISHSVRSPGGRALLMGLGRLTSRETSLSDVQNSPMEHEGRPSAWPGPTGRSRSEWTFAPQPERQPGVAGTGVEAAAVFTFAIDAPDVPEQFILEQSMRLPAGGAVTGWAGCRVCTARTSSMGWRPKAVKALPVLDGDWPQGKHSAITHGPTELPAVRRRSRSEYSNDTDPDARRRGPGCAWDAASGSRLSSSGTVEAVVDLAERWCKLRKQPTKTRLLAYA